MTNLETGCEPRFRINHLWNLVQVILLFETWLVFQSVTWVVRMSWPPELLLGLILYWAGKPVHFNFHLVMCLWYCPQPFILGFHIPCVYVKFSICERTLICLCTLIYNLWSIKHICEVGQLLLEAWMSMNFNSASRQGIKEEASPWEKEAITEMSGLGHTPRPLWNAC